MWFETVGFLWPVGTVTIDSSDNKQVSASVPRSSAAEDRTNERISVVLLDLCQRRGSARVEDPGFVGVGDVAWTIGPVGDDLQSPEQHLPGIGTLRDQRRVREFVGVIPTGRDDG